MPVLPSPATSTVASTREASRSAMLKWLHSTFNATPSTAIGTTPSRLTSKRPRDAIVSRQILSFQVSHQRKRRMETREQRFPIEWNGRIVISADGAHDDDPILPIEASGWRAASLLKHRG